jgi:probable phosphoglycerate mutase
MAGKAWLITHPETDLDKQGRVHGKLDPPLSASGARTADRIGRSLKDKGIKAIHASPRKRAQQTAQAISKHTGASVRTHNDLIPWDLGHLSGAKTASVRPVLDYFTNHPDKPIPSGESKSSVLSRYKNFMRGVKDGDVIVGHSQHSLALEHVQKGGDMAKVPMFGGKAGEVRQVNL